MSFFKIKKNNYIILSLITFIIFNISIDFFSDDFYWVGECSGFNSIVEVYKSELINPDNRIFYNTFLCYLFSIFKDNYIYYRIVVFFELLLCVIIIKNILIEYCYLKFKKKISQENVTFFFSIFIIFPGIVSATALSSSIMPLFFFLLYLFNLYLILKYKFRFILVYFFSSIFLISQYELYAGLFLTNCFIFYDYYKNNQITKKSFILLIFLKLFIFISIFFLITQTSTKNLGFFLKIENIILIIIKNFYFLSFGLYQLYGLSLLLLLLLAILNFRKLKYYLTKILKLKFLKSHIFLLSSFLTSILIINLGGYPITITGLHGRMILVPYFFLIVLLFVIIIRINNKILYKIIYFFFLIGFIKSSFDFYNISLNQKQLLSIITDTLKNKKYETDAIVVKTDLVNTFHDINLIKFINISSRSTHNVINSAYIYSQDDRCIVVDQKKIYFYTLSTSEKKFYLNFISENSYLKSRIINEIGINKKNILLYQNNDFYYVNNINDCKDKL